MQQASLPGRLRVREALHLFASFHDEPADVAVLLAQTGLEGHARSYFDALSGGLRARVMLALALVGRPQVLFLDEPTSALDPRARLAIWNVVEGARHDGTTVVLTTHDMAEAEDHCDRLCIVSEGEVIALGAPSELVAGLDFAVRAPARPGLVEFLRGVPGCREAMDIEGKVYAFGTAWFAQESSNRLLAAATSPDGAGLPRRRRRAGARRDVGGPRPLEDVYLVKTGVAYADQG